MKNFILKLILPSWVLELAKQIQNQPSRSTAHQFWKVRYQEWVPVPHGYSDEYVILNTDESEECYQSFNGNIDDLKSHLWDYHQGWCEDWVNHYADDYDCSTEDRFFDEFEIDRFINDLPDNLMQIYVGKQERIASTHLTENDVNWFIKRKQHDYPKLYTYVESAYWSPQLKRLQDWLKALA